MPLNIKPSSGSGSITLQATTGTTTNDTLTLPAKTGNIITSADSGTVTQTMLGTNVAGNGPAFSAYQSTQQTALSTTTWTKISFQTKEFDTNTNFDAATNFRFTPTIAGYYQFTGGLAVATSACACAVALYKNGSEVKRLFNAQSNMSCVYGTALIYMNGSGDYAELYGYLATGQQLSNTSANTYFSAVLVRAA